MLKLDEQGMTELTASGATAFTATETAEVFELFDVVRADRGGPETVLRWLHASAEPRALTGKLAPELHARGYQEDCAMCAAGAPARRYSVAKARRLFGVTASRTTLREHQRHARRRPLAPGTVRKSGGLPAPGARLDGDPRQEEPDYLRD